MKLSTIPLNDASDRQLVDYARTFLQLDVHPNAKRETVLAKIGQGAPGNDQCTIVLAEVEVEEERRQPTEAVREALLNDDGRRFDVASQDDPRFTIIIQEQGGLGNFGKRAVPVACNGRTMLIPRGKECTIPARYYYVLKEAMENHIEDVPNEDNPSKVDRVETEVMSYPFQIVKMPSQAELDAWNEKKKKDQQTQVAAALAKAKAA